MRTMKVGELKKILAVYADDLPVVFNSADIGRLWPISRAKMVVGTDEDISAVQVDGEAKYIQVYLHKQTGLAPEEEQHSILDAGMSAAIVGHLVEENMKRLKGVKDPIARHLLHFLLEDFQLRTKYPKGL